MLSFVEFLFDLSSLEETLPKLGTGVESDSTYYEKCDYAPRVPL